ncbi:MAG: DUF2680 domain-containing protein, partial [Candidatus Omnitrophica bacterium]|nr:DUF2680 domain-containing protein [Candidatus Omnitrophota bacterium]
KAKELEEVKLRELERKAKEEERKRIEEEKRAELAKKEEERKLAMIDKKDDGLSKVEKVEINKPIPQKITLKYLKEVLGLTDRQVQRIAPIMKEKADKRKEIISKYAGKGESAKEALKREILLFQKYYDDMYANILTEEQWGKYLALKEEIKKQRSQN